MRNSIRSAILAAALFAGLAPACAQVPPPVPALPDTERRTSYVISASTCACAVGFQLYGDSTDYTNWVEVFVNGARQPSGWTITSPTGALATIPRPITDAVLTFATAQTGTVQIVGARRPRRTSQFNEGTGVPTRSFNVVLSDLTAQSREVWDKINDVTGRSVRTPPGETLALLPVLASRANQGACFDSGGNLVPCVSVPSSTFAAGNGISFTGVNPTTITNNIQAGSGIVFTGTNPIIISTPTPPAAPYVLPRDYGAVCDGVTNDTTALQAAVTASAGKTLLIPASTCVITAHLNMPASGITITGVDRNLSIIKQTGADWIINIDNVSNLTIRDLWLLGNRTYTSWTASNIGAISITTSSAQNNLTLRNLKLSNFNSSYWIVSNQSGAAHVVNNVTFDNIWIASVTADIPTDPTLPNNTNYAIALFTGTGGSRWENFKFQNSKVEADGVCFGIILFSNFQKYRITDNQFLNPGAGNLSSHCTNTLASTNAYGIAVYDLNSDGNPPGDGIVARNYISTPIGAGIYVVGAGTTYGLLLAENTITGQTFLDSLLIRGGIAINGAAGITVANNILTQNQLGIGVGSQLAGSIFVTGNSCISTAGTSQCYNSRAGVGTTNTERVIIRGNYFDAFDTTVLGVSSTTNRFNYLELVGNTIVGTTSAINFGVNFFSGALIVSNNTVTGGTNSFGSITGTQTYSGNVGMFFTVATLPAAANASSIFVADGTPATCAGGGTGTTAFRQNGAWKCF